MEDGDLLLREMKSSRGTCVFEKFLVKSDSSSILLLLSSSGLLVLSNRWNTRRASSPLLSRTFPVFLVARSIRRVRIKNRFPPTISVLIGTARRFKVRYIGAVKLVLQKRCPKGSASCADKAAILRFSECTRLSQRALSPLPFGSREPFIEKNPFNVSFDVTAAVTLFFYHSRNRDEETRSHPCHRRA